MTAQAPQKGQILGIYGLLLVIVTALASFSYQHGRLEQKVIDNTEVLMRTRDQQQRDMTVLTQHGEQLTEQDRRLDRLEEKGVHK